MRQIDTLVRLRGNRGAGMAAGRLAGSARACYKSPWRDRLGRYRLPLRSRESDTGSVPGLLPPGAEVAKAMKFD